MKTVIGQLRLIGFLEGCSFLALLGIAMPLKYVAGMPMAVKIAGWVHGLLFLLYVVASGRAAAASLWSLPRSLLVFLAAVVPAGPFLLDGWLRRQMPARAGTTAVS